jgi:hypothetical protein
MTRRLKIESLESRQMLSADIAIYRNGILATDDSPEEFLWRNDCCAKCARE